MTFRLCAVHTGNLTYTKHYNVISSLVTQKAVEKYYEGQDC